MSNDNKNSQFIELLKRMGMNKDTERALTPEDIDKATKDINKKMEQYKRESSWALGQTIYTAGKTRLGPPR